METGGVPRRRHPSRRRRSDDLAAVQDGEVDLLLFRILNRKLHHTPPCRVDRASTHLTLTETSVLASERPSGLRTVTSAGPQHASASWSRQRRRRSVMGAHTYDRLQRPWPTVRAQHGAGRSPATEVSAVCAVGQSRSGSRPDHLTCLTRIPAAALGCAATRSNDGHRSASRSTARSPRCRGQFE